MAPSRCPTASPMIIILAQALADILTLCEHKGKISGQKMAYLERPGNDVAHGSSMIICSKLGVQFVAVCPKGYEAQCENYRLLQKRRRRHNCYRQQLDEGVKDSDVLYTDVFFSMGPREITSGKGAAAYALSRLNMEIYKKAKEGCITMHCLPAHREREVTEDILDGPMSIVFDEAENHLHAQKAVLALLLKNA